MMSSTAERPKSVLVILRRIYLDITGNHCAAKLIEYFKHWRNWKTETQRSEWVYMPFKSIYEDLMGEHSIHIIRKAIALLLKLNILSHRHNPDNGQDKTWQYRLNLDVLEHLLTAHRECNSALASDEDDQTYTQDQTQISQPQPTAADEKDAEEIRAVLATLPNLAPAVKPENCLPSVSQDNNPSYNQPYRPNYQELLTQVRAAGIQISPQLQLLVQLHATETVEAALAYTQYQVKRGKVQDVSAYFVSAVKGGWKLPAHIKQSESLGSFSQWFNWAAARGLVKYSTKQGSEIWVSADGVRWQQFEAALRMHPLEKLQPSLDVDHTGLYQVKE